MPVYRNVPTFQYYPFPELATRKLYADYRIKSILDVGAGHGGVFDVENWSSRTDMERREACDLFWIRDLPPGWKARTGIDACKLVEAYGEKSFDMVQCMEVLEHIKESRTALEQICAVARRFVLITSADEMQHRGPEQYRIEKLNRAQAYIGQPKVSDLKELGFNVRVEAREMRQLIAWKIL